MGFVGFDKPPPPPFNILRNGDLLVSNVFLLLSFVRFCLTSNMPIPFIKGNRFLIYSVLNTFSQGFYKEQVKVCFIIVYKQVKIIPIAHFLIMIQNLCT